MPRTVLLTGATGTVSTALRAQLAGSGLTVRALVRDPAHAARLEQDGVAVAVGDLGDPRSLAPAFEGVDDLWLLVANDPRAPEHSLNAVWAARQAGVERVVRLSAIGAASDAPTRSGRLHALADRDLQESGLAWTILRPHWFMQNLLNHTHEVATAGTLTLDMGAGRLGMVDVHDVAAVAARILTDDPARHAGRILTPTGPQALSFDDVAASLTRLLDRPVTYRRVTGEEQRRALVGHGVTPWLADMLVEYGEAYAAGWGDFTTTDVADVTGRAPRGLDAFLDAHREAFSGSR